LSRWGIFFVLGGLIPAAAWMSLAPLSSAVVAPAYVKVDLNRRAIQHAEGGTILQVLVRDGQLVQQGQPLLVLGDVSVDAEENRLSYRVVTEQASLERLDAEQTAKQNVVFSSELLESARQDPRLAEQLDKERQLFDARRDALLGQVRLLQLQREKVGEENDALHAQVQQAGESMKYQKVDLETNRKLLAEGFISPNRIAQLESATADYGVKIEENVRISHARSKDQLK
jgi:HlyD family secretion protein